MNRNNNLMLCLAEPTHTAHVPPRLAEVNKKSKRIPNILNYLRKNSLTVAPDPAARSRRNSADWIPAQAHPESASAPCQSRG
jgi:hypothetical protein